MSHYLSFGNYKFKIKLVGNVNLLCKTETTSCNVNFTTVDADVKALWIARMYKT